MNTARDFKKLGVLAFGSALVLVVLVAVLVVKTALSVYLSNLFKGEYKKPEAWVISQGLNSTLTKQQLLQASAKQGQVTLEDLARVATASAVVKSEAVKIGNDYLLSTGADGKVEVSVDPGTYEVELVTIPEIDFTGIPGKISISQESYVLNIGLMKGSGKVRSGKLDNEVGSGNENILKVNLFSDKNGNGKKDEGEPDLSWAGVTIRLKLSLP